jgi:hypothetical protein
MLKFSPIFERNGAHLVKEKMFGKKQGLSTFEVCAL